MKNQYFGDIGDYGKYGLLRFLAQKGVSIAVNWYLTPDDDRSDGKFTSYLNSERYRPYDPALFDALRFSVCEQHRRDVHIMEEQDLIPDARYYSELLEYIPGQTSEERRQNRMAWHSRALRFCAGADLVFLDPDNGIREKEPPSPSATGKYVLLPELVDYYHSGQHLVYYCHKGRRTSSAWIQYKNLFRTRIPNAKMAGLTFHRGTQRSYIFALQEESAEEMTDLLHEFSETVWSDMFTIEDI